MNSFSKSLKVVKSNNTFPRYIRRSKSYKNLMLIIDPQELYDVLYHGMTRGKKCIYEFIKYLMTMALNNSTAFPSTTHLAKKFGVHRKHISRVTTALQKMGLIYKRGRGVRMSKIYTLGPIFKNPLAHYIIYPLFPFMRKEAYEYFKKNGKSVESIQNEYWSPFSLLHVTPTINRNIIKELYRQVERLYNNWKKKRLQKEDIVIHSLPEKSHVGNFLKNLLDPTKISTPEERPDYSHIQQKFANIVKECEKSEKYELY